MRIGEALGLRHNDIAAAEREITVIRRDNDNGARAKSIIARMVPVSAELVRLYADYLHAEYGDLDSDYVVAPAYDHTARESCGQMTARSTSGRLFAIRAWDSADRSSVRYSP